MNRSELWIGLGVVGLGGLALAGSANAAPPRLGRGNGEPPSVDAVRGLAREAGLAEEWADFFAFVAWRESKGNPAARNSSETEAEKAAESYDRNVHRLGECGHPRSAYVFGSGGWFGFLPAVGLTQLGPEYRCLPPSSVFEPRVAVAMAVGFARGLMRWKRFQEVPTWLNLRLMWGSPSDGGDAEALRLARDKYEADSQDVGLDPEWLDEEPPPLPTTAAEILARLQLSTHEGSVT